MDRRTFLAVLCSSGLAAPRAVIGQGTNRVYRLGILSDEPSSSNPMYFRESFRRALQDLGYVEGRNIAIEYRTTSVGTDQLPRLASELVQIKVDVIVAIGTAAARAAKEASSSIPIVFARLADPVGSGLVASPGQPGGNATGVSPVTTQLASKRLELLKKAFPQLARVGVVWSPAVSATVPELNEIRESAPYLQLQVQELAVERAKDLQKAVSILKTSRLGAITLVPNPALYEDSRRVVDLLFETGLPTMFWRREWVEIGGLMSYGTNYADQYQRAATYVDRIFKGAKPADLPVEYPTTFELVINLRTAKALKRSISPSLLLRADHVIE
jgi:putative ABC transport system substrate-binding protein